jgi:hypothetical protein
MAKEKLACKSIIMVNHVYQSCVSLASILHNQHLKTFEHMLVTIVLNEKQIQKISPIK